MELSLDELYLIANLLPEPEAFPREPELRKELSAFLTRLGQETRKQEMTASEKREAARRLTGLRFLDIFRKAGSLK